MIVCNNINKSFGQLDVLKDINLRINKGEVVSIVGASGAGKSTLLQIMGSLLPPSSGEVIIDGTDICKLKGDKLAAFRNCKIGFVFQFHHLLPEFTALENVMLPAQIYNCNNKDKRPVAEIKERATMLLTDLGLGARLEHKPKELSGGEQQRVAIARALINTPAVLFADEPSGNLDSRNKAELHDLFFKLRDRFGQTIVIVTHERELARMSDRIFEMKDGRL